MTLHASKQAVFDVLEHRDPAYIPLGLYAVDCDLASQILGRKTLVRDKIGVQTALWQGERDAVAESLKEDSVELYRKLDCVDIVLPAKCAQILPPKGYEPPQVRELNTDTWETPDGTIYKAARRTNEIVRIEKPSGETDPAKFSSREFTAPDETIFEAYDHFVREMTRERFVCGHAAGFNVMVLLGGMEQGLMEYILNPDTVRAAVAYHTARDNFLDPYYARKGVDAFFLEQDFASSKAPLISPAMFEEFSFPAMKSRVTNAKKYRSRAILHSCGNIWPYMDMIAEAGFDGFQSLQTGVVDLGEAKRRYGDKICFWGGVPVEHLVSGTPDEVRRDVQIAMEAARENGGFILGPSHSIAYGTKYENFMAMLEEYDRLK